jgi:hypothetical protein
MKVALYMNTEAESDKPGNPGIVPSFPVIIMAMTRVAA